MYKTNLLSKMLLLITGVLAGVTGAWGDEVYNLYSGALTPGHYLIVYSNKAMKASVSNERLDYLNVNPSNNTITNPNEAIVWKIEADGNYFTLFNESTSTYAASTGTKNKAKLESSITDNSRWTVTGTQTYEFLNKKNNESEANAHLRNNGTYGFACYSTSTGGALSLYKKDEITIEAPTFSLASSQVAYGTSVTLSAAEGQEIMYTTDGTIPTIDNGYPFSDPIAITQDMTIKAIAIGMEGDDFVLSPVATATYTLIRPAAPTFSIASGSSIEAGTEVTITAPENCIIVYTNDSQDTEVEGDDVIMTESNSVTLAVNQDMTIHARSYDSNAVESSVASATYTTYVMSNPTFSIEDITMEVGALKTPSITTESNGQITYTSADESIAQIVNGQVRGISVGTTTITANITQAGNYYSASTTFSVTVTPLGFWENTSKGIDVLSYDKINPSGNNGYRAFTGKSFNSSAVYAGQIYKETNLRYIQMRNSNPSGIVTTTSGGRASKVIIDWNSSTTNGRYISVYGKNTAYSTGSDLYTTSTRGTLLGTIVKGTNTELVIDGDYLFIGLLASEPLYATSITIYWEGDNVTISDASNYSPIAKDYVNMTLDRSFVTGWNGIVLPFDLTNDVKTAMGATDVKTLGSATAEGNSITLNFTASTLPVAAGTPVLVKLSEAKNNGDIIIKGVEIKTTAPTTMAIEKTVDAEKFTLKGTYESIDESSNELYFVSGTKFYHKAKDVSLCIDPLRAYIVQESTTAGSRKVNFNLDDNQSTGIVNINANNGSINNTYDLQGRQVALPTKGLYIVNGKKVVIR